MAFHCRFTNALCISPDVFAYFQSFSLKNYDKGQQAFKIHHRLHPAAQGHQELSGKRDENR